VDISYTGLEADTAA